MIKSKRTFEKIRNEELSGKLATYPALFLSNRALNQTYNENLKMARKLL